MGLSQLLPEAMRQEWTPEEIEASIQHLTEGEKDRLRGLLTKKYWDGIDAKCSKRVVSHAEGFMYFLRNHTKTENYHAERQGVQPREPFPYRPYSPAELAGYDIPPGRMDWDYLDWTMWKMLDSYEKGYNVYLPKSRELITSWLTVAYIFCQCQFYPAIEAVGQSESDRKAQGLVKYANILYDNQDDELKARHPLKRGSGGQLHKIEWANGSSFTALPQGERQTASSHPTIFFNDESAHQAGWKSTINVVKPVAKQILCVSSAAYSEFGFHCEPTFDGGLGL